MSIAFFLIALAAPHSGALPTRPAKQFCRPKPVTVDARRAATIQPLAAMPPAKQIRGVYSEVDGCPVLSVVRERVGQPLDQEPLHLRYGYNGKQPE